MDTHTFDLGDHVQYWSEQGAAQPWSAQEMLHHLPQWSDISPGDKGKYDAPFTVQMTYTEYHLIRLSVSQVA